MEEVQSEVAAVHVIGERYLRVKQQIADSIAQQKNNREALGALKERVIKEKLWLQRPGGVYLHLPTEQCAKLLLKDQGRLAARLEGLFAEQRRVLRELEERGVEADYIHATA